MRHITDVKGVSLVPFVCDVVEQGSEILTDGWSGYNDLHKQGYKHSKTVLSDNGDPAHVAMPGPGSVTSSLTSIGYVVITRPTVTWDRIKTTAPMYGNPTPTPIKACTAGQRNT